MSQADDQVGALIAQSNALLAVNRFGAAAERASDAARADPNDPRAYWAWSLALNGDGQFAEAGRMADESIRLAPESAQGFRLRSMALSSLARSLPKSERGRLGQEAVISAREAVRLAPHDANSHLSLAGALTVTGELSEADRAIHEVLRLAPNSAAAWVTASLVALSAKNWDAAIKASRRALEIDPENYAALNNLGVALRASGKNRKGTRVLAEAARANPDERMARQNLSRVGLRIVRVAILLLLLPLVFFTQSGIVLYLAFAIGSNIAISRNPALALRLERVGAPVALFFAGRSPEKPTRPKPGRRDRGTDAAAMERPWSAMDGHRMHTFNNPVLIFCAVAAWMVALIAAVGLVLQGTDKAALAFAFAGFAVVGALPLLIVRRRRQKGKAWSSELAAGPRSTSSSRTST